MYPYKLQNFYGLRGIGKEKRLKFAEHCQNHRTGYSEYLFEDCFPDECIFRLDGSVNKQKCENLRVLSVQLKTIIHLRRGQVLWLSALSQKERLYARILLKTRTLLVKTIETG